MKFSRPVALATWMLEHLSMGANGEALAGDLLEELRAGRSTGWYFRQVASAVAAHALAASRVYGLPLIFSIGWSVLYPAWLDIARAVLTPTMLQHSAAWPTSALLELTLGVVPAATFVWIGLFMYLSLRVDSAGKLSMLRLLGGLSVGLNVVLLSTFLLLFHATPRGMDLQFLVAENLYSNFRPMAISIPLAMSVYPAILWGLFRHYWVLVKLLLTTFTTIVLLAKMPLIGYAARRAAETTSSSADLRAAGTQLAVHASGGLLVLIVVTALSVYKPWGPNGPAWS